MKTQFVRMLFCSICISLTLAGRANAQEGGGGTGEVDTTVNTAMNHVFGTLDQTKIPFGLLRDYAWSLPISKTLTVRRWLTAIMSTTKFCGKSSQHLL
jgi:hypothetical protein